MLGVQRRNVGPPYLGIEEQRQVDESATRPGGWVLVLSRKAAYRFRELLAHSRDIIDRAQGLCASAQRKSASHASASKLP